MEIRLEGTDIEEGEYFGVSGAFQDNFLVGIDPLSKDSSRFEKMFLEISRKNGTVTLQDFVVVLIEELDFAGGLVMKGKFLVGGIAAMAVLIP